MTDKTDVLPPEQTDFPSSADAARPADTASPDDRHNPEEIQRIRVDDEDRLAFRVGVNILTLVLIGVGIYLLWRQFAAGN